MCSYQIFLETEVSSENEKGENCRANRLCNLAYLDQVGIWDNGVPSSPSFVVDLRQFDAKYLLQLLPDRFSLANTAFLHQRPTLHAQP